MTDTTRYTWDGLYPVVEWNNQGKLKQSFVYANGLLLGIVDSTVATNKRYYVLHDGLGSSVALTDSAANIKRSLIYSDFGELLVDTTASGTPALNRLYAGYAWDGSPANSYWMKYRQTYDPGLGRFGQEDPALQKIYLGCPRHLVFSSSNKLPQLLNKFVYVTNGPITNIDPNGLGKCEDDYYNKFGEIMEEEGACLKRVGWTVLGCLSTGMVACRLSGIAFPECMAGVIATCEQIGTAAEAACATQASFKFLQAWWEYSRCLPCEPSFGPYSHAAY